MGEYELFTLAVAIAIVMIIGRTVATRLEVPEAIVLLILGVLASLIPQVPNIDLPPNLVLFLFLPPLVYNAAFFTAPRETTGERGADHRPRGRRDRRDHHRRSAR